MDGAETFNALCSFLRRNWAATGYKRSIDGDKKRPESAARTISATSMHGSRNLQGSLSCGSIWAISEHWETITFDDLNADYERLENNARHNKIFRGWRAHIAKIEYGLGKDISYAHDFPV